MLRPLLAAASIAALTLPVAAGGSPIKPLLTAKVTATSIAVVDQDGRRVQELAPTTYRFVVRDRTRKQNFHLTGPSVNVRTKVPARTTVTWSLNLRPGTYTYRSDRNTKLRGTFTVRPGPPPA